MHQSARNLTTLAATAACGLALSLPGCASTQTASDEPAQNTMHAAADTATPVNTMCPIGKEPVAEGIDLVVDGETVAFCCAGCQDYFAAMPEAKQMEFVELARAGRESEFSD